MRGDETRRAINNNLGILINYLWRSWFSTLFNGSLHSLKGDYTEHPFPLREQEVVLGVALVCARHSLLDDTTGTTTTTTAATAAAASRPCPVLAGILRENILNELLYLRLAHHVGN